MDKLNVPTNKNEVHDDFKAKTKVEKDIKICLSLAYSFFENLLVHSHIHCQIRLKFKEKTCEKSSF